MTVAVSGIHPNELCWWTSTSQLHLYPWYYLVLWPGSRQGEWTEEGGGGEAKCISRIVCESVPYILARIVPAFALPFHSHSDQVQSSPALSPAILHHTAWRAWLFIAHLDERWLYYQFSPPHLYISLEEGWENVLFELGSERVKDSVMRCLGYRDQTRAEYRLFSL